MGKREISHKKPKWNYSNLYDIYSNTPDLLGERLLKILKWASDRGALIETDNIYPAFRLKGKYGKKIMSFWAPEGSKEMPGSFYCDVHSSCHGNNEQEAKRFVDSLNIISLFNYKFDKVDSGRNSSRLLHELSEEEFIQFIDILDQFCYKD